MFELGACKINHCFLKIKLKNKLLRNVYLFIDIITRVYLNKFIPNKLFKFLKWNKHFSGSSSTEQLKHCINGVASMLLHFVLKCGVICDSPIALLFQWLALSQYLIAHHQCGYAYFAFYSYSVYGYYTLAIKQARVNHTMVLHIHIYNDIP